MLFGTAVSNMQTNLNVNNDTGVITGTLKYLSEGQLVTDWGEGYFMALKFKNIDPDATSVLVGMDPSQSSGLVELINDPDKNGVFKVTDKSSQVFKVIQSNGVDQTVTQTFDLTGLVLEAG